MDKLIDLLLIRYVYDEKLSTGRCAAIVRGETRCLAADIGAAAGFQLEHLEQSDAFGLISAAAVVYVEGYFATHSLPAALEALQFAHRLTGDHMRLVSLSALYVCLQFHEHFRSVFADSIEGVASLHWWNLTGDAESFRIHFPISDPPIRLESS